MQFGKSSGTLGQCHAVYVVDATKNVDYVFKFLNGLNESYQALRSQIILMKPFPTLDQAYNVVIKEENQRSLDLETLIVNDSAVMAVRRNKANLSCTHCGKQGHIRETCCHLIGFPPNFKFTRGRGIGNTQRAVTLFQYETSGQGYKSWFILESYLGISPKAAEYDWRKSKSCCWFICIICYSICIILHITSSNIDHTQPHITNLAGPLAVEDDWSS